jgi:hypothetical protein
VQAERREELKGERAVPGHLCGERRHLRVHIRRRQLVDRLDAEVAAEGGRRCPVDRGASHPLQPLGERPRPPPLVADQRQPEPISLPRLEPHPPRLRRRRHHPLRQLVLPERSGDKPAEDAAVQEVEPHGRGEPQADEEAGDRGRRQREILSLLDARTARKEGTGGERREQRATIMSSAAARTSSTAATATRSRNAPDRPFHCGLQVAGKQIHLLPTSSQCPDRPFALRGPGRRAQVRGARSRNALIGLSHCGLIAAFWTRVSEVMSQCPDRPFALRVGQGQQQDPGSSQEVAMP